MKKNDIVIVTIEDIGIDGAGIGKADGYTLFIKGAIIGDVVEAKLMKAKKSYGYARLMKILSPSKFRTEPACTFARKCGGCQIQELSYEKQLELKERKVKDDLMRIGEVPEAVLQESMEPIVGMEDPFHYRNKAQFPIGTDKEGNIVAGFYAGRTHSIIPNTDCALGIPANKDILDCILAFMKEYRIPAYDEKNQTGLVRHVLIRSGFVTKEIMTCIVINGKKLPHSGILAERLSRIAGMTSITLSVNRENTNVIMGNEIIPVWGQAYITDYIGDVQYRLSPLSFFQVNPVQTERLYRLALAYAGLTGEETVWDLYCGIGTISLFLAKEAKQVYGVEIVEQAIEDARENARINGIRNATFYTGRAEEILPACCEEYARRHAGERMRADVIVVDPPRKGCDETLLQTMVDMGPERIVYVSCDPATLARDVKLLRKNGYEIQRARAVDQFPQTVHVEVICLLSKLHAKQTIEVELKMSEMDLTAAECKATYEEIKDYVLEHMGLKVSSLYIAQVKQKCSIIERENYNLSKSENSRQPKCPPEKEKAIRDALEYFRMI